MGQDGNKSGWSWIRKSSYYLGWLRHTSEIWRSALFILDGAEQVPTGKKVLEEEGEWASCGILVQHGKQCTMVVLTICGQWGN